MNNSNKTAGNKIKYCSEKQLEMVIKVNERLESNEFYEVMTSQAVKSVFCRYLSALLLFDVGYSKGFKHKDTIVPLCEKQNTVRSGPALSSC